MINFKEFLDAETLPNKEWLVIGKGPSFAELKRINLNDYITVALNHVIREVNVDFAHIIDLDVLESCSDAVLKNAKYLIMPLQPHVNNKASKKNLADFMESHPVLESLKSQGRLLWYNSSTGKRPNKSYPIIPVRFFSADAMIALLGFSNIKVIRTCGIDGGSSYSNSFQDLNEETLLSNGRPSFDIQFLAIAKTLQATGATMTPITEPGPIKVYVGTQQEQIIAVKVLEYSIKKHSSCSVEVFPMHLSNIEIPTPADKKNRPRTPFSFQRFMIPELNNFSGKAIYLDSDMQVFTDIRDLWNRSFGDSNLLSAWSNEESGRIPQFSVMLMDCDKLQWNVTDIVNGLNEKKYTYEELMWEMKVAEVAPEIEPEWNSLEHFEKGKTKLLHYTDMNEQPWLSRKNPWCDLWVNELKEAIDEGFISLEEVIESIHRNEIRPSLYLELTKSHLEKKTLDTLCKVFDKPFIPPHKLWNGSKTDKKTNKYLRKITNKLISSNLI